MDWERETQTWVDEGLIDVEQRPALLERLEGSANQRALGDAAPVGLVTVGMLFMNASAATALAMFDDRVSAGSLIVAGLAVLQGASALGVRIFINSAVAHGIGAAAVVTYGFAIAIAATPHRDALSLIMVAALCAIGAALVIAVRDAGRGLAASAGVALVPLTLMLTLDGMSGVRSRWIFIYFGCLAYAITVPAVKLIATLLERALPRHYDVLIQPLPFVGLCVAMCTWLASWEFTAAADALFGVVLLIGSRILGSRLAMITGLAVLLCAQLPVLFEINEPVLGMAIMGIEGMALLLGAITMVVMRQAASSRGSAGSDSSAA